MSTEADLVGLVQRTFPKWGSETPVRLEGIGVYAAAAWSAGGSALRSRGIPIPDALHAQHATLAQAVASTRQGGTRFLAQLRAAVNDDAAFLSILTGVGSVYARFQAGRSQAAQPAAPPPTAAATTTEIAGFEVGQLLGKGNMGQVFKARQKSLDRIVALKVLDGSLADEDPTFVNRFTSEAKAVAQLNHVNIVGVIDQGTCPRSGVQFIAFEFIDGQTVQQLQQERGGKLAESEALGICLAVLEALNCAEERGIVHRDVKPDNILIGRDGTPKLADLGLAKRRFEQTADKELTQSGLVVGTPQYMAPEQAMGLDEVDTRADLYSLGICLFRFLTGGFPFTSETPLGVITQHINQDVPDPRTRDPGISPPVAQLVLHLAARDRDRRYPSAYAAAVDIERVLEDQPILGPARAGTVQRAGHSGRIRIGSSGRWMAKDILAGVDAPPIELIPPGGLGPGEAELWKYERSGHHEHLAAAQREFNEQSEADDPEIQAHGRAGLARVHLLNGDPNAAKTLAEGALEIDPDCLAAAEVLIALERGDADHAGFAASMAQVTALIRAGRYEEARERAAAVRREFPSEPHPHLALAVAASRQGDQAGFQEAVQLAWALFPSKAHGDQPLGAGFDASCMSVLADHGWAALTSGDEAQVRLTVEEQDDKTNLVAGALRMAVALGHSALAQGDPPPELVRRLLVNVARAVGGLQHFTAAQDMLRSLQKLDPSEAELKQYEAAARAIAGFQGAKTELQTGIKPRRGRYACPIGDGIRSRAKKGAKAISAQRTACETEVTTACARVAEIALDETLKAEVQRAATTLGLDDPYAPLLEIEANQQALETEVANLAEAPDEPEPDEKTSEKKTGFFARLKGAAKATGRAAKHGQLKLKEAHLRSRHTAEVKALGDRIVRELGRYDYQHPELQALTRKARRLLTTGEALRAEEERLKRVQEWLAR